MREMRCAPPSAPSERSGRALGSLLRAATVRADATPWDCAAPVLVVHARDDHHVPVDFALAACARHPEWQLRVVERGGHHLHVDHPRRWLGETLPWLAIAAGRNA